jgi:hypothetical protein
MNCVRFKAIIPFIGVICVLCLLRHSVAQERVLFDLKQVADKPRHEVEKILGEPSTVADDLFRNSRGTTYAAIRATYLNGAVEVTYLEGGARYLRIWIQKLSGKYHDYSYPKDGSTLIGDLGLDRNATADISNQGITRWRDFPGIYEINVFPTAERKIWYAHVLTSRIYQ